MRLRSGLLCVLMLSLPAVYACSDKAQDKKSSRDDDEDEDDTKKKKKKKKADDDDDTTASSSGPTKEGDTPLASAGPPPVPLPTSTIAGGPVAAGCESYFKALDCMVTKVPAQTQQQMKDSFEQAKTSLKQLPPDLAGQACQQAVDAMKEQLKTMGCAADSGGSASTSPPATATGGTAPTPGGKSAVPTPEEWAAQTKEVSVPGSTTLGCETKQVREWIRVSCRGKNDTGGEPTAVRVTKGGGRGEDFVFAQNKVASLVYRWFEGQSLEAEFRWTDKARTLVVAWPSGAPEPPIRGAFK